MSQPLPRWAACLAAAVLGLSCERIGYYSLTGSAGAGTDPSGPSAGTGTGTTSRGDVLAAVATCSASLYAEFDAAAADLDQASAALASAPSAETQAAAREAWARAIAVWQQAELIQVGPAGSATLPGGEGLRDYVYSWPLVSRCLVEQTLVSEAYDAPTFPQTALLNMRGLAATEYLLFFEGAGNSCPASSNINAQGTWAALGSVELAERKRRYAAVLAADVASVGSALHAGWQGPTGFAAGLAASGSKGSPFESDQAALNAVSDGLFYLELEVKDLKLGRPLGKVECTSATCPEAVESLYAGVSRDHVRNNLLGFRRLFDGCDEAGAIGFDDLLRSVGAAPLADQMSADITSAITAAEALPSADFVALLQSDAAALEALHAAIKRITDALKTQFVTVLDVEPPVIVEGDND